MKDSKISWTDHTFNPWIGCSKVHAGCANCYAEADFDHRKHRVKWGPNGTRSVTSEANWKKPLRWNREAGKALGRPRVFCASLADVFEPWDGVMLDHRGHQLMIDERYPEDWACGNAHGLRPLTMSDVRARLFRLIDKCQNLDFLLLTKRSQNIRKMWAEKAVTAVVDDVTGRKRTMDLGGCLRPNVWLGTSVSDQETADRMIDELCKSGDLSPVLFSSCEPLLKNLSTIKPLISWWIIGCESGPRRRPMRLEWAESIVQQCLDAGVACWVKQIELKSGRVSTDPSEWPESLRVQQLPKQQAYVEEYFG